jgi:hypothetical protein
MLAYHFQTFPRLPWEVEVPLPCEESLWELDSVEGWQELINKMPGNLALLYFCCHLSYILQLKIH